MKESKRVIRQIIILAVLLIITVFGFELIVEDLYSLFKMSHVYESTYHAINLPLLTWQHIVMSFGGCFCSIVIGMAIGIFATTAFGREFQPLIEKMMSLFQAIPTIGFLSVLIPVFGFGVMPGIIVLVISGIMPIVFSTITGINNTPDDLVEVGQSVGMKKWELFFRVKVPSAIPVIVAGLRTTSVIIVGCATLAAITGAGGLGQPIFSAGIRGFDPVKLLEGTIPVTLLALLVDRIFEYVEIRATRSFSQ